jgi:hypothetical protein
MSQNIAYTNPLRIEELLSEGFVPLWCSKNIADFFPKNTSNEDYFFLTDLKKFLNYVDSIEDSEQALELLEKVGFSAISPTR